MSQMEYDLAEFVVSNRDVILEYLNQETEHLSVCEEEFDDCPEIYDELLDSFRIKLLIQYLGNYFSDIDTIHLIVDREFIKMTLYMEVL